MPDRDRPPSARFSFDALYESAARVLSQASLWRSALVSNVAPRAGDVIVPLGYGASALAVALALAAPRATILAIEPDDAALMRARHRAADLGAKIEYARGFGPGMERLLAEWAPNKIVASFVERPADVHEKQATIAAAHAAMRGDGVLHLVDMRVSSTQLVHSTAAAPSVQPVDKFAHSNGDSLIAMMRGVGFVAAERTEIFPAARGDVALYRARIS